MSNRKSRNLNTAVVPFERFRFILKHIWRYKGWRLFRQIGVHIFKPGKFIPVAPDEPRQLRTMLELLGPAFMKLGQILTMRPDLLPREYIDEFARLYDTALPFSIEEVRKIIHTELKVPPETIFSEFDPNPIASASIGQVHKAILKTGERVVVKVQRPGIEELIQTDIALVLRAVKIIESFIPFIRFLQLSAIVLEIDKMLQKEINYLHEAKNVQRIYNNFRGSLTVKIPKVYTEYTTRRVLVLEYIDGIPLNPAWLHAHGYDTKKIAHNIANAVFKQIFQDGYFHGDPSPGNIFVLGRSGKIAFLDFGAMGEIPEDLRRLFIEFPLAVLHGDSYELAEILLQLGEAPNNIDKDELARDLERIIIYYKRKKPTIYDVAMMNEMIQITQKHNLILPPEFMLIERALFETASVCDSLDPNFDILKATEPTLREVMKEQFSLRRQVQEWSRSALKYYKLFQDLPTRMERILKKVESGDLKLRMVLAEPMFKFGEGLPYAILIGLLAIASALVIASERFAEVGLFGFGIAIILSIVLMFYLMIKKPTK